MAWTTYDDAGQLYDGAIPYDGVAAMTPTHGVAYLDPSGDMEVFDRLGEDLDPSSDMAIFDPWP